MSRIVAPVPRFLQPTVGGSVVCFLAGGSPRAPDIPDWLFGSPSLSESQDRHGVSYVKPREIVTIQ